MLQASTKKLKRAVEAFQPTVVHFICHGGLDAAGNGFLELFNDETSLSEPVKGSSLVELLCRTPPNPVRRWCS